MEIEFECIKEFALSLDEVGVLLDSAEANVDNEKKYAVYNKSAILLLAGKFENFAESLAEEYIYRINSFNLRAKYIPESLRMQHTYRILRELEICRQRNNKVEMFTYLTELGIIWNSEMDFNRLDIECKFSYGKHGEKELKKLFSTIGVESVFDQVKVYRPQDTLLQSEQTSKIDIKGVFNSVTNIRNNILHQDATPNLTTE